MIRANHLQQARARTLVQQRRHRGVLQPLQRDPEGARSEAGLCRARSAGCAGRTSAAVLGGPALHSAAANPPSGAHNDRAVKLVPSPACGRMVQTDPWHRRARARAAEQDNPDCNYRHPLQRAGQVTSSATGFRARRSGGALILACKRSSVTPSKVACRNASLHPHFASYPSLSGVSTVSLPVRIGPSQLRRQMVFKWVHDAKAQFRSLAELWARPTCVRSCSWSGGY
jgi:hypothetical protein